MWTLSVLVLTLLVSAVQASSSSSGSSPRNHKGELSGQALTDLYNSGVYKIERMKRPLSSGSSAVGPFSHTGVRVTLEDGNQWLIHKGRDFGISSQTVVTRADHMSSKWKPIQTKNFHGSRTVGDLVKAGGSKYNLLTDNCHRASARMMRGG